MTHVSDVDFRRHVSCAVAVSRYVRSKSRYDRSCEGSYELSDDGIVLTRYTGMESEPRIERGYGGVPVVKLGHS